MIQDDKNYYDQKNFVRDDSFNGMIAVDTSEESLNYDLTGGNPSKPYPITGNFVRGSALDGAIANEMQPVSPSESDPDVRLGQVKYARREGAPSIYKDATRNTADDNRASRKAESSTLYEVEGEGEESQGI